MKLFKKGLLVVAVPGLFELALLAILYKSQENATQAELSVLHTKDVIIQAAQVREPVLLQSARLRSAIIRNDTADLDKTDLWDSIEKELGELHDIVSDNPQQLQRVAQIRKSVEEYKAWVDIQIELLKSGQQDKLVELFRNPAAVSSIQVIQKQLVDFIKIEEQSNSIRLEHVAEAHRLQNIALVVALLGSILAAAVAAKIFSKDVVGRLAVLTSNSQRLSEGGTLANAVGGNDEIAELDTVLHETSKQ